MKQLLKILLLLISFLACHTTDAQSETTGNLGKTQAYVDDAWFWGQETATTLEFNNSATNLEDIRRNCFEALSAMDSIDMKLQLATYSLDDAYYEAKDQGQGDAAASIRKIKPDLTAAAESLVESRKNLDAVLDETDLTAISQKLFDAVERLQDCRQSVKNAQKNLKNIRKQKN
ncbi:hypothetical protein [Mangrovibacterium diazotrophicum]|uniref:Uncharacterized protein n=1 Tax=Mangrovibacterium diazotrophicum TaxID=1261403 RepID=A0A419W752_9BACT|nr:hypothetical protein [Mangrovibacterium diazotrophicum]RKD91303.1 hypothetical protein BC643_1656 [Mangrovibacterium diazotrophicum]